MLRPNRRKLDLSPFSLAGCLLLCVGCGQNPPPDPSYLRGQELFENSCAACHQTSGWGEEGVAPPLVQSPWVLGPESRMVRIVLHGVRGPINVNGRTYNLEMEFPSDFSDQDLADVLTYVRKAWGNDGRRIDEATVRGIREAEGDRDSWTVEELMEVE
ncbi:MAG: cytochrome c [Planctomycetes bacterium]|nr:cytochrome c [Planctomycetota bacterium]